MRPVARLQGMNDLSQAAWRRKRDLQDRLVELIGSYGYHWLDTPILEPTELFLRKAGGEMASQMYSFTDAGSNPVSLRPEFTSPIMRHYLEHAGEIDLPSRWQYAGPVFRYEEEGDGRGQFTQLGAELLGSSSVMADVELLSLAARVPSHLGIENCRLEMTDLDLFHSVLDATGVSDRARTFVIASISQLKEGPQAVSAMLERAEHLHVAAPDAPDDYLSQAIAGLDDTQSRKVLQGFLQWSAADQLGQRQPGEVVDRLLRKLRGGDDRATVVRAMELVGELAAIRGEPQAVLAAVRNLVDKAGSNTVALERLEEFLNLVSAEPGISGRLVLNLGLVRGLAYYNGLVFEVTHPDCAAPLGGGGRYDELALALGSPKPLPALGFAFNLEALLALTGDVDANHQATPGPSGGLVLAEDTSSYGHALKVALSLREQGIPAELDVCGLDLKQALAYCSKKGISRVIVVDHDGNQTSHPVGPAVPQACHPDPSAEGEGSSSRGSPGGDPSASSG